jgi:hypothetical protein
MRRRDTRRRVPVEPAISLRLERILVKRSRAIKKDDRYSGSFPLEIAFDNFSSAPFSAFVG